MACSAQLSLWIYGLLSPAAGYFADRFGRRLTILISLLVWSAVTWATGHAQTFSQLLWARALMGISEACFLPAALAWIAEYHDESTRALATGLLISGNYVGIVIGGAGGGWMGDHFGWRPAFTVLGGVGIVYTLVLWLATRKRQKTELPQQRAPLLSSIREVLRLPDFITLTLVFGAVSTANWVAYTWLPLHLYERLHINMAEAGFTATFYVQAGSFAGIALEARWPTAGLHATCAAVCGRRRSASSWPHRFCSSRAVWGRGPYCSPAC